MIISFPFAMAFYVVRGLRDRNLLTQRSKVLSLLNFTTHTVSQSHVSSLAFQTDPEIHLLMHMNADGDGYPCMVSTVSVPMYTVKRCLHVFLFTNIPPHTHPTHTTLLKALGSWRSCLSATARAGLSELLWQLGVSCCNIFCISSPTCEQK